MGHSLHQYADAVLLLCQFADMTTQTRLQVGSLVLVDNVGLCQFVQHLLNAGVKLDSLFLVSHSTQFAHCYTHRLCVILIMELFLPVLTDSLE